MDGREGMALSGSSSYYLNRGVSGSGHHVGSGGQQSGLPVPPPGYKPQSNPNISPQSNLRINSVGSSFQQQFENSSPSYPPHVGSISGSMAVASSIVSSNPGETVKKKRGRPRKYGPGGAQVSLGLSPVSPAGVLPGGGAITPTPKKNRGRPPGSGRKQRLASLGEWMNNSAGLAFTPHIIQISVGEDVAAKILSFAQQRPRALCILSGNGAVSALTLRQPTTSGGNVTYEGRFEILCLSGSYLLADTGGPRNRTGGLSISVCSHDGHVLGGAIGGRLIAASLVQVVVCSFVYGGNGSKPKDKTEAGSKEEKSLASHPEDKLSIPTSAAHSQNLTQHSGAVAWPLESRSDMRNSHTEIDLTRG